MTISLDVKGKRFGFLTAVYRDDRRPHRISCRCNCKRLVHVAIEDLVGGTVTSCGCRPSPPAYWAQQQQLRAQLERESLFRLMQPTARAGR